MKHRDNNKIKIRKKAIGYPGTTIEERKRERNTGNHKNSEHVSELGSTNVIFQIIIFLSTSLPAIRQKKGEAFLLSWYKKKKKTRTKYGKFSINSWQFHEFFITILFGPISFFFLFNIFHRFSLSPIMIFQSLG